MAPAGRAPALAPRAGVGQKHTHKKKKRKKPGSETQTRPESETQNQPKSQLTTLTAADARGVSTTPQEAAELVIHRLEQYELQSVTDSKLQQLK